MKSSYRSLSSTILALVALLVIWALPSVQREPSSLINLAKIALNKMFLSFLAMSVAHLLWKMFFPWVSFERMSPREIPLSVAILRGMIYLGLILGFLMGL